MIYARLHPPVHKEGVPYTGRYAVEFNGEVIVKGSRDPETDLARALLARSVTGKLTLVDAYTLKPRTVIDIEKAAKLRAREDRRSGPRFTKWQPYPETSRGSSPSPEDALVLPTLPEEEEQAA